MELTKVELIGDSFWQCENCGKNSTVENHSTL